MSISTENSDEQQVLALLRELSQQLLAWSWEGVAGYEEIVERVGRTYGYPETSVIMGAQAATIKLAPDGPFTFVKSGIPGFPPLAFTQDLEDLIADIYSAKVSAGQARDALKALHKKKPPNSPLVVWLGVIAITVSFALDIIGTTEGLLWGGITAMATGIVFLAADRIVGFNKIAQLVATFASGVIVMLAAKFGWIAAAPGLLLISSTFVFLPGDSISTQAYEIAAGRWSAGVDRLFYSILTLVLMATGAFLATMVTGTNVAALFPTGGGDDFPWWAVYPGHVVMLIGILLTFQMSWKHFPQALIAMMVTTAVAQIATMAYAEIAGTFIAMAVGTIVSLWMARKPYSVPAFVLIVPLIFALSPGSHGLRQLETWLSGQTITGISDLQTTMAVLLAIAMGMVVGGTIGRPWRWLTRPGD